MNLFFKHLSSRACWLTVCVCAPVGLAGAAPAEKTLAEILAGAAANQAAQAPVPPGPAQPVAGSVPAAKPTGVSPVALPASAAGKVPESIPLAAPAASSVYSGIYEKNVFDPDRQPWADKTQAPAPSVAPLTSADAEIYGVMMFGNYKKAIIKLGPGFKFAPQPRGKSVPRPFVTLGVGEALGPYSIVEITDKTVVFEGGGARFPLAYTHKKNDRPAGGAVTPMAQSPVQLPAPVPTIVQGIEPIVAPAQATQLASAPVEATAPAGGQQAAPQQAAPAAQPESSSQPPAPVQGMTLLEAIQAARAAQQSGTAPVVTNPFVK